MVKLANVKNYTYWIENSLRPDVYAVFTLKQQVTSYPENFRVSTAGTRDIYEAAYKQFICRLSAACYGKTHWRRLKRLLPNTATLEGNGNGTALGSRPRGMPRPRSEQGPDRHVRYHLNVLLRTPPWMTFEEFKSTIEAVWTKSPWALPDINIEKRTGDCVGYSLKEGPESLIVNAMNF